MIRISVAIIGTLFFLTSCMSGISHRIDTGNNPDPNSKYATGITEEEKVELALERKKELRTIRKWDFMALKNNPEKAILYYQAALEKLPDDILIRRKFAHTYFLLRDWKNSYLNYSKIPISEIRDTEQQELFQSLFFDETQIDRLKELDRYSIDQATREYYGIIDICYSWIHNCIVSIEWYSGQTTKIINLQKVIKNATQISPDFQYRNFLVTAELYQYGMYRVADILATEILQNRPNYNEVRKLKGFALYELGKYIPSRDILLAYIEQNPKDLESIIKLGEIYATLGDYTTSSLYLNNAITGGYPHKTEIERRLAYNYSALWDVESMLKVLGYLLQEKDTNEDDFAVAISLALEQGQNTKAYVWAYTGIEKYPKSTLLMPLYLSALRLNGRHDEAIKYIESLKDDVATQNPIIQLEYAIALHESGFNDRALGIFMNLSESDPFSDWATEAQEYIQIINSIRSQSWFTQK
jgi:tetratricopeptide (TPR) repeat protein